MGGVYKETYLAAGLIVSLSLQLRAGFYCEYFKKMENMQIYKVGGGYREGTYRFMFQDIFKSIYAKREENTVYLKDVVIYLRAANENVDDNMQVNRSIVSHKSPRHLCL